jgi:GTP pyrophosphokinase
MLEKILTYFQDSKERTLIREAFGLAEKAHGSQRRESGGLYIQHPLNVALTLTKMNLDTETIAAALLHDVAEDTSCTIGDIEKQFGKTIASLVNGVTKLDKIKYSGIEGKAENLRKMFLAMAQDIRVVLIKLADRYHNMQTLETLHKEDQKRIALETLEIYAPIAHRLGMGELKGQLEDLAFKYLYPEEYERLENEMSERYEMQRAYIRELEPVLYEILKKENVVPLEIHARAKHFYSLYKKLIRYQMNFDKIHDLVAARIIVKTIEDCYLTLGVIHQMWKPVPGLIKDYIAMPKPNGYQSLHTSVFGPEGKITEIQIRTPEMHEKAENGIAAHWAYKEREYWSKQPPVAPKELFWIEQLRKWQRAVRGSDEFFESLRIDFFKDRIFVLTPLGDVIDLPEGATPVDFAYHIHTTIGNECTGARINGRIAPLDTKLESGDLVEIITQKGKKPSADWLNFAKTNLAKDKIRSTVKVKTSRLISQVKKPKRAELKITARDRIGLIKDITNIISSKKINIVSFNTDDRNKNFPVLNIILNLKEKNKLQNLVLELKKTKGVEEVSYET